jgi:hypothetical protein
VAKLGVGEGRAAGRRGLKLAAADRARGGRRPGSAAGALSGRTGESCKKDGPDGAAWPAAGGGVAGGRRRFTEMVAWPVGYRRGMPPAGFGGSGRRGALLAKKGELPLGGSCFQAQGREQFSDLP